MPHETMTPLTMPVVDSGLDFFAVANYNLNNGSDTTLFDYHSSDNIFDNFGATFGSVEDTYCS